MTQREEIKDLPRGGHLGRTLRHLDAAGLSFVEASYPAGHRLARHRHVDAHFCFVLSGSVLEETGASASVCKRNTLLFRRPGEVHAQQYGDEGARCFSFFLTGEWHDRHDVPPTASARLAGRSHSQVCNLMRRMYAEFRSPDRFSGLAMEGMALGLMAETARTPTRAGSTWAHDALARLEHANDTGQAIRIGELAKELGVDASQLIRGFRAEFGASPAAYIRKRRLDRAYEMIADGDLSLADVAARTGFCDQSHLTRTFAAHFGMPPGACRRNSHNRSRSRPTTA